MHQGRKAAQRADHLLPSRCSMKTYWQKLHITVPVGIIGNHTLTTISNCQAEMFPCYNDWVHFGCHWSVIGWPAENQQASKKIKQPSNDWWGPIHKVYCIIHRQWSYTKNNERLVFQYTTGESHPIFLWSGEDCILLSHQCLLQNNNSFKSNNERPALWGIFFPLVLLWATICQDTV